MSLGNPIDGGSGATATAGGVTASSFGNLPLVGDLTATSNFGVSKFIQPFFLPYAVSADYIRFPESCALTRTSQATSASTFNQSFSRFQTANIIIYTRGTGASSQSLQSYFSTSASQAYGFECTGSNNQGTTTSYLTYLLQGVTSSSSQSSAFTGTQTSASWPMETSQFSRMTGVHWLEIPFATSLSAGEYYLGIQFSSASSNSFVNTQMAAVVNFLSTHQPLVATQIGIITQINGAAGTRYLDGLGTWTSAGGSTTSAIAFTNITHQNSAPQIFFQMLKS
jgi:hypothetical protein